MTEKTSILNLPARKFFVVQLTNCFQVDKDEEEWIYQGTLDLPLRFNQVWIQGFVVLVSADGNDVLVDDGTGVAHATGVVKLVKNFTIIKGMYVMVAGQLKTTGKSSTQTFPSYPTIRILKFADKSEFRSSETLWMLEVMDLQRATSTSLR
ncbi:uncharacterized protein LOC110241537 [Exaiptasia diaphana]|uniref:RecQ-mediated genome instability protein 2 n=1 Tax=Exaiptasia diaphana TaxID=2652724 RepID=A0A913XE65_EXADI|nr:uncharacterized protein LOC110241537 [Exaiptasia diaphana]KXJ12817.1 hypothetical protein AC249_AIPGENE23704 [Exaiptasia diaphana]